MTLEAYFVQRFENDPDLMVFFNGREDPSPWIYSSSSLGKGNNPQVPEFPYIVYNELPTSPFAVVRETSNAEGRRFTIYVYDEIGDFTRINAIHAVLRKIVKRMAPFKIGEGAYCLTSEWEGLSGRIVDDPFNANTRIGTARFIVSEK